MDVYCLCAEWCSVCRKLKPAMDELRLPGVALHWVDIEDEPDWGEDHDIVSFPTLVIKVDAQTVFTGTVEPQIPHIRRLLEALRPDA